MLMRNTSGNTITIPGDVIAKWETSGPKPATVEVPPSGIVHVLDEYACPRRARHSMSSNPQVMPSVVHDLTGGVLKPHGLDAVETSKLYVDQLPSYQLAQAKIAATDGEMGVSSRPDPAAEQRKLAEEYGRRMLAVAGELRESDTRAAKPVILTDAADTNSGTSP